MKYLILNGSPRKEGYTTQILKQIQQAIPDQIKGEWVDVNSLSVKPCISCLKCRPDKECILPEDDGHRIGRLINEADYLIMGSPTYWGNMSGALKLLIDRLLTVFEYLPVEKAALPIRNQKGKKAFIVTACNCPWPLNHLPSQSKGTIRSMKTVLKGGGYRIAGIIDFHSAKFRKKLIPSTIRKAKRLGAKVV